MCVCVCVLLCSGIGHVIHTCMIFCPYYIAEEDRKQFYEVIGYSEDEEYIEYPKEVHHL